MKNIHLLPTEKPSKLYYKDDKYKLANSTMAMDWYISSAGYKPTNIYITSDEEIKEGDWGLSKLNEVILFGRSYNEKFYKKIILTTDQDLIADGVQAIDDEFLEWFVKNPSCEVVKIEDFPTIEKYNSKGEYIHNSNWIYKIIIPQEQYYNETFKSE